MKSLGQWFSEYGESHQNHKNKLIHYICVPAIYMSTLGAIFSIPFPIDTSFFMDWTVIVMVPILYFYFRLSAVVGITMAIFTFVSLGFIHWWHTNMAMSVLMMSTIVFVAAWIMQFVGHKIEGKKPSFFKDLQFLLIGPAWIVAHFLKIDAKD